MSKESRISANEDVLLSQEEYEEFSQMPGPLYPLFGEEIYLDFLPDTGKRVGKTEIRYTLSQNWFLPSRRK